jgi:large subunit ribosomal protein L9
MKVILNKDLAVLGEEGDVKDVAKGYARNFLFPRGIALPYNEATIRLFESRREEIEDRKAAKRLDASGLKEKLEAAEINVTLPAGPNGKLYGAVTSQTVADELSKLGFQIERKRIEVPGNHIKNVGKYKIIVRLYETAQAEINLAIQGQVPAEEKKAPRDDHRRDRRPRGSEAQPVPAPETAAGTAEAPSGTAAADTVETAPAETAANAAAAVPEVAEGTAEAVPAETAETAPAPEAAASAADAPAEAVPETAASAPESVPPSGEDVRD